MDARWRRSRSMILVGHGSFFAAAVSLEGLGYEARGKYNPKLHNYPAQARAGKVVTIDLRRDIEPQWTMERCRIGDTNSAAFPCISSSASRLC